MKRIKYLFFTLFIFLVTCINVDAEVCDSSDIKRLKEEAKNVVFTYEYDYEKSGMGLYNQYNLSVNGLTDELYAVAYKTVEESTYFYYIPSTGGSTTGSISSGEISFNVYSVNCDNKLLNKTKYKLPIFNVYSLDEECIGKEDLDVCLEFVDENITLEKFSKAIDEYNSRNDGKLKNNFLKDNMYLLIGVGCVVVLVVIVLFVLKRRKDNKLD